MRSRNLPVPGLAPIEVRRIRPGEGAAFRAIRLRALRDSPLAFGTTWAEASARPAEWWDARVAATSAGEQSALFVAARDGAWAGLLGGEPLEPGVVEVVSMWVDPAARRGGIGLLLLDAVTSWAAGHGATEARLHVTDGNVGALALYVAYGFEQTGVWRPHSSRADVRELEMRRPL